MKSGNLNNRPDELPFFTSPGAFVIGIKGADNKIRVVGENTAQGPAVRCYLSPVNALIDASYSSRAGEQHQILCAGMLNPKVFRDADGRGLIADIHLGWAAHDGRIALRADGVPAGSGWAMHHWAREPASFDVDTHVLQACERLHERAGLYAWRETFIDVLRWEPSRLGRVAFSGLSLMKTTSMDAEACEQVALFDPEFGQWHFVPRAVTDK